MKTYLLQALIVVALLLKSAALSDAKQANLTIDDTNGDEITKTLATYNGEWFSKQDCETTLNKGKPACSLKFDDKLAHDGTWHCTAENTILTGNTFNSVVIKFNGTSLWANFIYPDVSNMPVNTYVGLEFQLDGQRPSGSSIIREQSSGGSALMEFVIGEGLNDTEHTFLATSQAAELVSETGGNYTYIVCFDYALYTADVPDNFTDPTIESGSSAGAPRTSAGAIAGGTVGGVVVLLALLGVLIFYKRKQKTRSNREVQGDTNKLTTEAIIMSSYTMPTVEPRRLDNIMQPATISLAPAPSTSAAHIASSSGVSSNDIASSVAITQRAEPSRTAVNQHVSVPQAHIGGDTNDASPPAGVPNISPTSASPMTLQQRLLVLEAEVERLLLSTQSPTPSTYEEELPEYTSLNGHDAHETPEPTPRRPYV